MYTKLASLFFVIIIVSSGLHFPYASSQVQNPVTTSDTVYPSCISKMTDAMHSNARTLNGTKAVYMATNQTEFKSKTQGFTANYSSTFNTWKLDPVNCTVSWNDVNVGYQLYNGTRYVKNIVVTLDPALTRVIKIDEQVGSFYTTSNSSANWSGYDLAGSNNTPLPTILNSAITALTLPSVSQPTDMRNPCRSDLASTGFQPCDTSIWTGLEDTVGASDGNLVQAGSDGEINCTISGCTTSYFLWYEFLPNAAFTCNNSLMVPSNLLSFAVTNEQKNGGSSSKYDLSLQDTSIGWGCSVTGQSYTAMTAPKYAPFILERAQETSMKGYPATLASFTTNTGAPVITGTMYYNGASNKISSNVLGAKWTMSNQGNNNISLGTISSGQFTQTWQTSDGTLDTCIPPRTGDLTISASCTVPNNVTAPGNIEVQSGGNLMTIPSGVALTIHFATKHLQVDGPTGGVLIKSGGKISS